MVWKGGKAVVDVKEYVYLGSKIISKIGGPDEDICQNLEDPTDLCHPLPSVKIDCHRKQYQALPLQLKCYYLCQSSFFALRCGESSTVAPERSEPSLTTKQVFPTYSKF